MVPCQQVTDPVLPLTAWGEAESWGKQDGPKRNAPAEKPVSLNLEPWVHLIETEN